MRIRRATFADIPSIISIERESATAAHWTEERYEQAFTPDGPERLVLLAEEALSTLGRSAVHPRAESSHGSGFSLVGFLVARHVAPDWELENIVVHSPDRGKGLGKLLLGELLAAARETNSEALFLEVRESNVPARSFYEKGGFRQIGRRKSYYNDPAEDAVLYCRMID